MSVGRGRPPAAQRQGVGSPAEPIDLPDGSEVALTVVEDGDDLDDDDRTRLHDAFRVGQAEMDRGEGIPADEVLAMLRAKHG
jgi:hypothetical protein